MKLIIQNARIAGTATDAYTGPDDFIQAPHDFDPERMGEYVIADGVASLPTVDVQALIVTATQARLDAWAQARGYDGILSACTYASSTVPKFAVEGQSAVNARDATWSALYTLLGEVQAGTKPMPASFEDVVLPDLVWADEVVVAP
jgi:hypothetical protein